MFSASPLVLGVIALLAAGATVAAPADGKAVLRCGWFQNPTPANAWLNDRDGQWLISSQGGHQAEGDWPNFPDAQWVATNGSYGYGCACLRVHADAKTRDIARVVSAHARPLAVCRADRALKEPKE